MIINEYECKMCGECCKRVPCEFIPKDLIKLLDKYNITFKEAFKKYLIAIPCTNGEKADIILRLSPVRQYKGKRFNKFLEDEEYMDNIDKEGECIFLHDNKCKIHDVKPFGGRIMKCSKMTGGLTLQLTDSQYFVYWYNNQQIFWELSEEIKDILIKARNNYNKANEYYKEYFSKEGNDKDISLYRYYKKKADNLMLVELKHELNKFSME